MLLTALLLSTLAVQQPTQQPAAAPAQATASQQRADTSKAKPHRARRARKAKANATPRDTTKSKP